MGGMWLTLSRAAGLGLIALAAAGQSVQAQNAGNGEDVFKKCRVCHDAGPEAKNKIGPALRGVFGRKAGSVDGFNYSEAMREAGVKGLVWSDENIEKYLDNPRGFLPGNKMAFPGVKDDADRKDVIAYLKSVSQ
ncbi:MAG: cytochrome c family protein [Hyphomicrobiaceae bacterium]